MISEIFKNYKVNFNKLVKYGFTQNGDGYNYSVPILGEQFLLSVIIDEKGQMKTKVIDADSKDDYVLHLMPEAVGEFVGKIKQEYEKTLNNIKENCFEKCVFKSKQAEQVISYVQETYGDNLEFLWEKISQNAIWRRKDNKKWYGALLIVAKTKIGLKGNEEVEIIDLRINPSELEKIIDNKKYFAGYHMNKKHWFTICLDGSVPTKEIFNWIDKSYSLAKK